MNTKGESKNSDRPANVTSLLSEIVDGNEVAAEELLPQVYNQLRVIAQQRMSAENPGHALQATALVHEAFLRLIGPREVPWQNQAHFFVAAGQAMRRILLDHAKAKRRQKRGGTAQRVPLNVLDLATSDNSEEILALDEAVRRLEQQEPEAAAVVHLRYYAGLSIDEAAMALEISPRTVDRRWKFARAWLLRELQPDQE